jgi:hypothetical protein
MDANPPAPPADAVFVAENPINPFNGEKRYYVSMQGKKLSQRLYARYYQVGFILNLFYLFI